MTPREPNHHRPRFWHTLGQTIAKNPISLFAVLCVAATAAFLGYMALWQTGILTSPDWCHKAQRAERLAPGQSAEQSLEAIKSCNDMLLVQLNAIATDSHIDHSVFGLVLVVLIVVVVAGAKASFKATKDGIEGNVARNDATPVQVVNAPSNPVPTTETPSP